MHGFRNTGAAILLLAIAIIGPSGTRAATAPEKNGRAKLTINFTYDSVYTDDYSPGRDRQNKKKQTLHASGSLQRNELLVTNEDGSYSIIDGVPDNPTAADAAQVHSMMTFQGESTWSGALNWKDTAAFHGDSTKGTGSANYANGMIYTVDAGFFWTAGGQCHYEHHNPGSDDQSSDLCEGNDAAGVENGNVEDGHKGASSTAPNAKDTSTYHRDFEFRIGPKRGPDDGDAGDYGSNTWYGGTTTGNDSSGYTMVFDGTRKRNSPPGSFDTGVGEKSEEHLHVVATLVPLSEECHLDGEMLKRAYDRALVARGIVAPPEYLSTSQAYPQFLKYNFRLATDNSMLPTWQWIKTAVAAGARPQPSAQHVLVGSVQVSGKKFRVVARIVETGTAVVLTAGMGDGTGCEHGLDQAVAHAISSLSLQSYRPYLPK